MLGKYFCVCVLREWDDGMGTISPLVNTVFDLKMVSTLLAEGTLLLDLANLPQ
jgi:hypothetical protein